MKECTKQCVALLVLRRFGLLRTYEECLLSGLIKCYRLRVISYGISYFNKVCSYKNIPMHSSRGTSSLASQLTAMSLNIFNYYNTHQTIIENLLLSSLVVVSAGFVDSRSV